MSAADSTAASSAASAAASAADPLTPAAPAGFEVVTPATLSQRVGYVALRALVAALGLLGWRGASAFGAMLGHVAFAPVGIRRRIVEDHLRLAFPDWSPARVSDVAREAYASLGRTFIETAVLPGRTREQILELVPECVGWDVLEEAHALGRGIIAVSGHIGNWELGGAYIAARGIPVAAITRRMANPLFDRYLRATRQALRVEVIHDAVLGAPRTHAHCERASSSRCCAIRMPSGSRPPSCPSSAARRAPRAVRPCSPSASAHP